MKERVPDVLDVLAVVAIPNVTAHEDSAKQIAPLCTAYGINREYFMESAGVRYLRTSC